MSLPPWRVNDSYHQVYKFISCEYLGTNYSWRAENVQMNRKKITLEVWKSIHTLLESLSWGIWFSWAMSLSAPEEKFLLFKYTSFLRNMNEKSKPFSLVYMHWLFLDDFLTLHPSLLYTTELKESMGLHPVWWAKREISVIRVKLQKY